jgi:hypothetical protein
MDTDIEGYRRKIKAPLLKDNEHRDEKISNYGMYIKTVPFDATVARTLPIPLSNSLSYLTKNKGVTSFVKKEGKDVVIGLELPELPQRGDDTDICISVSLLDKDGIPLHQYTGALWEQGKIEFGRFATEVFNQAKYMEFTFEYATTLGGQEIEEKYMGGKSSPRKPIEEALKEIRAGKRDPIVDQKILEEVFGRPVSHAELQKRFKNIKEDRNR